MKTGMKIVSYVCAFMAGVYAEEYFSGHYKSWHRLALMCVYVAISVIYSLPEKNKTNGKVS